MEPPSREPGATEHGQSLVGIVGLGPDPLFSEHVRAEVATPLDRISESVELHQIREAPGVGPESDGVLSRWVTAIEVGAEHLAGLERQQYTVSVFELELCSAVMEGVTSNRVGNHRHHIAIRSGRVSNPRRERGGREDGWPILPGLGDLRTDTERSIEEQRRRVRDVELAVEVVEAHQQGDSIITPGLLGPGFVQFHGVGSVDVVHALGIANVRAGAAAVIA